MLLLKPMVKSGWGLPMNLRSFSSITPTHSWNAGLDLAFLNNRIEFVFDAYLKNTDNLLMQAALPAYISGVISVATQ